MLKPLSGTVLLLLAMCAPARADFTPNDPFYFHEWSAVKIGLPSAWMLSTGSGDVKIAVLDTGVISTTPDLQGRLLPPLSSTGSPPFSDTFLLASPVLRHGTWVSSIAAMNVNNGVGGAGVGNFSILPITIANSDGLTSASWVANAITQAADAGARVINLSFAVPNIESLAGVAGYARSKGALVFAAAGNSDARINRAAIPDLIFISGTNRDDQRWSNGGGIGSSWGPYVKLSAPADDILVADPTIGSGYGIGDGTSFAAPLVSGAAALAWSINPNLTPDQVESMLYSTAVDLGDPGWDEVFGYGRIDIGAMAQAAYATVPEPGGALVLLVMGTSLLTRRTRHVQRIRMH